ncbi:MAG: diphosphate--fructose-6-phosphate 1-phosphotransferase, partial [Thermomicrobiales bacterium]
LTTPRTGPTMLIGQSGGATAVINASLIGALEAALDSGKVGRILGMRHGIEGVLKRDFIDLTSLSQERRNLLRLTPSSALGTGRYKVTPDDLDPILDQLARDDVRYLLYIGGNDSADTVHKLAMHAARRDQNLAFMSIPKTVDNDLAETHHCPGYGSVCRYIANFARDAIYDTFASPQLYAVKFIEVMGRDAGWVTAAGALAMTGDEADLAPLLLLPERPPRDTDEIVALIKDDVARRGWSVVVVPETLQDASGRYVGGDTPNFVDSFGHEYYASPGAALSQVLTSAGLRARYDKPGTSARMSNVMASSVDLAEAEALGAEAARLAIAGETAKMTALRQNDQGGMDIVAVPVERVANRVRLLDDAFIGVDGHSVTDAFHDYALPLLGPDPFPPYGRL